MSRKIKSELDDRRGFIVAAYFLLLNSYFSCTRVFSKTSTPGFRCNVFLFIPLIVAGGRLCVRLVMNLWNMLER